MKRTLAPLALSMLLLGALSAWPLGGRAATPAGAIDAAGWSSGWVPLSHNNPVALQHNLGGDILQYATQLWFWDTDPGGYGVNTRAYGGMEEGGIYSGAYWQKLTDQDVEVTRSSGDDWADQVRMWIWVPDEPPAYCSDWMSILAGASVEFYHYLGGDVDDYVVGLWFKSGNNAYGINQHGYGGMEAQGDYKGAWWNELTENKVQVQRAVGDPFASWVRVCVDWAEPAEYDSGWVDIAPDQVLTLAHHVGGNINGYVVRIEFKDAAAGGSGIHHENVGGNADGALLLGANWQNLTSHTIDVFRLPDDETVDQVRVRIWQRTYEAYLPLIMRDR